jgi:hypothetical protein
MNAQGWTRERLIECIQAGVDDNVKAPGGATR